MEEHENCNDATVLSTSSHRNYHLLRNTYQASSESSSSDVAAYSDIQGTYNTEQSEMMKSRRRSRAANRRSESRSCLRAIREIVVKFWLWEVAACIFSLVSLASIVGVLIYEDGKVLDQWEWSIPPTAVVSFIGTLNKASLVLVLSQVLSQLKWLHFKQVKSLRHVRTFDEASRGPLGALLIIKDSKNLLSSITACLMVLTLLVDPFVQLVFTFPSRRTEDDSQQAIFHRIVDWSEDTVIPGSSYDSSPDQNIVGAINEGLATTNITFSMICPSGNCAWSGPIKTLGVCGSCSNVTVDIKSSCSLPTMWPGDLYLPPDPDYPSVLTDVTCNYTINGSSILQAHQTTVGYRDQDPMYVSRTLWNSTILQPSVGSYPSSNLMSNKTKLELNGKPIVLQSVVSLPQLYFMHNIMPNFATIRLPVMNSSIFTLTEMPAAECWNCETYLCEKSFEAVRIIDNAPPVFTVSTKPLTFIMLDDESWYGLYSSDIDTLNDTVWNFRYRVDLAALNAANSYLYTLFYSYFVDTSGRPEGVFWGDGDPVQSDLLDNPQAFLGLVLSENLNTTIHSVADSLTDIIRTGGLNAISVVGQNFVTKSFIHVRWVWLALPLALVSITSALLLIVAVKSHVDKVAAWKDDPLALLFHNVSGASILPGGDFGTMTSDLDSLADEVCVKLDQDRPFTFLVTPKEA